MSAEKSFPAAAGENHVITASQCRERPPVWLVQRVLEKGAVAAIAGPPGSGKSFLSLDFAAHVGAGRTWFGRKTIRGAVVYIAAEAPASVERRLALLRRLKFGSADLPVLVEKWSALLGDPEQAESAREYIESLVEEARRRFGLDVVLIVVDTVAASMGGGAENAEGMQRLVTHANILAVKTGAAVALVHHPNSSGGALRGHSSLLGTLSHGLQIELRGSVRIVKSFKQRDAEKGGLFSFRLAEHQLLEPDNFGDFSTSCVVEEVEGGDIPVPSPSPSTRDRLCDEILAVLKRQGPNGESVAFADIKAECSKVGLPQGKSQDAVRKALQRAIELLKSQGEIVSNARGCYALSWRHLEEA